MNLRKLTLGLLALAVVMTGVGAAAPYIFDAQSETTVWTFDEATCERYSPYVQTEHLDVEPSAVYCAIADSDLHDTTVVAYWYSYPAQEGVIPGGADSHVGDREPVMVHVDPQTGGIQKVVFSQYHYFAGATESPTTVEVNDNDTHVSMHIVRPYHHFVPTDRIPTQGTLVQLKPLMNVSDPASSEVQEWYADDWSEDVNPDNVMNPHRVEAGDNWWSEDTWEGRWAARTYGWSRSVYDRTGYDIGGFLGGLF